MDKINEILDRVLMFEPDDIGRGIGDILDKIQFTCLIILGIFIVALVLWLLSLVFGRSRRG